MAKPLFLEIDQGTRHLAKSDPIMKGLIARVGRCPLERAARINLFEALLRSVIYQQLHGKAAAAIHLRVVATLGGPRVAAAALQTVSDETLRAAGLSRNKLLALRDLAAKTLHGTVPTARESSRLSDEELIARLTAVRGIGPWTVHMLLIFHLGRPDVLPTGDYAVGKAFSLLYRQGRKVKPEAIVRHARRWQPYRSIASWYLWRSLDRPET